MGMAVETDMTAAISANPAGVVTAVTVAVAIQAVIAAAEMAGAAAISHIL
jgi:hypothetical protein